jgi:hypothetical protein
MSRARSLPPATRRRLGPLTPLRDIFRTEILRMTQAFLEGLGKDRAPLSALQSRLEVEVRADVLGNTSQNAIQEIELRVSMDDVEEFLDVPGSGR